MHSEPASDQSGDNANSTEPYIPASQSLPEITIKALILGALLSVLLAGANAYLGLKAGLTVSASIPAAVISMAVLRLFKRSNILENNIVQTAASAGESLAAGVIFTIPALVLLGKWTDFNYFETTIIAGFGGMLGVLFTIPLRRALIVESPLKFPEGVATAEVLKVGEKAKGAIKYIIGGGLIGAVFKFGEVGIKLWVGAVEGARQVGNSIAYFGSNAAPALVAVGYIVGINIAILVFMGGAMNWLIAVPIYAASSEWPAETSAHDFAWEIWSTKTRYIGVGAMVIGGLWALMRLWKSLVRGIVSGFHAYRAIRRDGGDSISRTERDTPMQWVSVAFVLSAVPLFFLFNYATGDIGISVVMALVMLIAGFLFSAVASYMAGLVGSSNNPISGVTIATLLTSSLLLLALGMDSATGPAAALFIGGVVCCAAAIGGDNMQDLKAGRIVGATPWKQQVMQVIGVLSAAVVLAPILSALLRAYGMGDIVVAGQDPLQAPQATLMKSVAEGVFAKNLPWAMITIGMAVAAAIIIIDLTLEAKKTVFRMPVLAVAVGIYLPLELSVPIFFGGLVSWAAHRFHMRRIASEASGELKSSLQEAKSSSERHGLLLAAGLITGEAILGILLAIPLAAWQGENKIANWFASTTGITQPLHWPSYLFLIAVMVILFRVAARSLRR